MFLLLYNQNRRVDVSPQINPAFHLDSRKEQCLHKLVEIVLVKPEKNKTLKQSQYCKTGLYVCPDFKFKKSWKVLLVSVILQYSQHDPCTFLDLNFLYFCSVWVTIRQHMMEKSGRIEEPLVGAQGEKCFVLYPWLYNHYQTTHSWFIWLESPHIYGNYED